MSRNGGEASGARRAPEKVLCATRVNVAFPFSSVKIHEPSEHLIELTALVRDMSLLLGDLAPGPDVERLSERAGDLLSKLR